MIYFDNASTTKQSDEVTKEMLRCMEDDFGNPSSLHGLGLAAERNLKRSRDVLIEKIGAEGKLIFTSGGTEADNMAVIGVARAMKRRGRRVIVSAVEHPAVLESARELEAEGFIHTMPGRGSFVAPQNPELHREECLKQVEGHLQNAMEAARRGGITLAEVTETLQLLWEG